MRIAFVLSGLGAGGSEKIVNLLAHHRRARGDTVHVVAVNANSSESYFPYDGTIKVEPLADSTQGMLRIVGIGQRLLQLRRSLRRIEPDIIISFLTKINVLAGLATYGLAAPIIMSERNNFKSQDMNPFWRIARPIVARRAESLVMQTRDACQSLSPNLRAKTVIIPNPVTLPRVSNRAPGNGSRVIAVGRLEKQKGFDLLLDAFKLTTVSAPAATLTIFGDGPMRDELERQALNLGIADRVRMPGVTKSPVDWIASGDVFVLSSRFEGFPNVLLEAMTAGLATIAFDCPWGPSEILSTPDSGLLVPCGNVEQLGEAIRRVVNDPTLQKRLATAGSLAASSRYAKSAVLEQWDVVIDRPVMKQPAEAPEQAAGRELERRIGP